MTGPDCFLKVTVTMQISSKLFFIVFLSVLAVVTVFPGAAAGGPTDAVEPRYGVGIISGHPFDPVTNRHYLQVSAFGIWDYDKVWRHRAPDALRFKVEADIGATTSDPVRMVASLEMLALYYLDALATHRLRPYVSAGFGGIYTDFQARDSDPPREEMGSRLNFSPLVGLGVDIALNGAVYFATVRLSHVSNADLNEDNRGLNSVVLAVGRFF